MFKRITSNYGDHIALAVKRAGEWKTWTYRAYYDEAYTVAKGLIQVKDFTRTGCHVIIMNFPV